MHKTHKILLIMSSRTPERPGDQQLTPLGIPKKTNYGVILSPGGSLDAIKKDKDESQLKNWNIHPPPYLSLATTVCTSLLVNDYCFHQLKPWAKIIIYFKLYVLVSRFFFILSCLFDNLTQVTVSLQRTSTKNMSPNGPVGKSVLHFLDGWLMKVVPALCQCPLERWWKGSRLCKF